MFRKLFRTLRLSSSRTGNYARCRRIVRIANPMNNTLKPSDELFRRLLFRESLLKSLGRCRPELEGNLCSSPDHDIRTRQSFLLVFNHRNQSEVRTKVITFQIPELQMEDSYHQIWTELLMFYLLPIRIGSKCNEQSGFPKRWTKSMAF